MANQMIALQARGPQLPTYNELVAGRDQAMARQNMMALQQMQLQQAQANQAKTTRDQAAMAGALSLARGGDFAGAEQSYGLGAGNLGVHETLSKLQTEHVAQAHAKIAAIAAPAIAALKTPDVEQRKAIFQQAAPALVARGWTQEQIAQFPMTDDALKSAIANAQAPEDALKGYAELQKPRVVGPGAAVYAGGTKIAEQPANVPQGQITTLIGPDGQQHIYNIVNGQAYEVQTGGQRPGSGGGLVGGARGGGGDIRQAIIAQESGGDYTRVSPAGAMGAYQVMPATAKTIASRLGLPWNPSLMTSNTPEARRYQDAIGNAALDEAIQAGGGDVATTAAYYHGGSDRSKWGPKTQQYVRDIQARMGQGGNAPAAGAGGLRPVPKKGEGQTTEDERKIASNVQNMISASQELANVMGQDPSAMAPGMGEYAAGGIPFVGKEASLWAQSGGRQRFNSAMEKILAAVTYINTGAGVSKEQMEGYRRSYFPTAQDTPRTRQQKMLGVIQFIEDAKARAGSAWRPEMDAALKNLKGIFGRAATYGSASAPSAPAASAGRPPAGVSAEEWKHMTPEDRKLWAK